MSLFDAWVKRKNDKGSGEPEDQSEQGYGLHTVIPKDSLASETVDIIAIHGLNGHHETTWTDEKTGVNWLRDCMPIHNARVLSFSYNSSLQFSKSTSDIYVFADQLLAALLASRDTEEEKLRPIIFVCHSLGGIVFKQALIRAHESREFLQLRKFIRGVIFFGTPHRGSEMAGLAHTLATILKAGAFSTSTNTLLSKDLEPSSRVLQEISRSFVETRKEPRFDSMQFLRDGEVGFHEEPGMYSLRKRQISTD